MHVGTRLTFNYGFWRLSRQALVLDLQLHYFIVCVFMRYPLTETKTFRSLEYKSLGSTLCMIVHIM